MAAAVNEYEVRLKIVEHGSRHAQEIVRREFAVSVSESVLMAIYNCGADAAACDIKLIHVGPTPEAIDVATRETQAWISSALERIGDRSTPSAPPPSRDPGTPIRG